MKQQILVFSDVYNEPASRSQADAERAGAFGWAAKAKIWDRRTGSPQPPLFAAR